MDIFYGVLANAVLVIAGTSIGILFKNRKKLKTIGERIFQMFGIFVLIMGIQGTDISQPIYFLICSIIGTGIGEAIDLDDKFDRLGKWLQVRFTKSESSHFAQGFLESTLLFCIGSMTFLGALEAGIEHTHTIYLTKGLIDGIAAITIAMVSGVSVYFSAVAVLLYQGILVLLASFLAPILTTETIAMCASIGSLSLVGIGCNMLLKTNIKVANFLPAMFLPMVWQGLQILLAGK